MHSVRGGGGVVLFGGFKAADLEFRLGFKGLGLGAEGGDLHCKVKGGATSMLKGTLRVKCEFEDMVYDMGMETCIRWEGGRGCMSMLEVIVRGWGGFEYKV